MYIYYRKSWRGEKSTSQILRVDANKLQFQSQEINRRTNHTSILHFVVLTVEKGKVGKRTRRFMHSFQSYEVLLLEFMTLLHVLWFSLRAHTVWTNANAFHMIKQELWTKFCSRNNFFINCSTRTFLQLLSN